MLRAAFPAFSLPTGGPRLALLLSAAAAECAGASYGAVLGFGGGPGGAPRVELRLDCAARQLVLWDAGQGGSVTITSPAIRFQLPNRATGAPPAVPAAAFNALLLSLGGGGPLVCVDGQQLLMDASSSADLLQRLAAASTANALGPALVLGAPTDTSRAARVDLGAAFVTDAALPCARTAPADAPALLSELAAAASSGSAPTTLPALSVQVDGQPGGQAAVVGQALQLLATATPAGSASGGSLRWAVRRAGKEGSAAAAGLRSRRRPLAQAARRSPPPPPPYALSSPGPPHHARHAPPARVPRRLRLVFFGLPPLGCTAAECGDLTLESPARGAPGQPAHLEASATYPKAGRYIVRIEVGVGVTLWLCPGGCIVG